MSFLTTVNGFHLCWPSNRLVTRHRVPKNSWQIAACHMRVTIEGQASLTSETMDGILAMTVLCALRSDR